MGNAWGLWLMRGQCTTVAVSGPAYPPPPGGDGPYFLGAVADPQDMQVELFEDNNTHSTRVGVGNAPDFIVKSVTGPASAQPGQQVTAQVEVCNQGTMDGSTGVEMYLSADAVITPPAPPFPPEDSLVGGASTPWLMVGQCAMVAVNIGAYPPPPGGDGAYYLGAVIDPQNAQPELIEDNNSSSGYRMGVGNAPDFVVKSVTGPASAQPWQSFTAQVEVCNEGTADGSTDVEVYLSADAVITPPYGVPQPPDYPFGMAPTPWLMKGQCATVAVNGSASVPPPGGDGPYYLGAVADPQNSQTELMEDNNTNSTRIGVGNRADFIVKSVTGPASVQPGQPVTAQVTVCNQGTMDGSTGVEVYLSADAVITPPAPPFPPEDSMVGGAPTPWLMVGQCATVAVNGPAYVPPPGNYGPYYLGAVVDPQNAQPELTEDNNTNSGYRMGVGNAPDFVVKSVTGPASAQPGQPVTAQVEVCNQGTMDGSTGVEVYLSADAVITPPAPPFPPEDSIVGGAPTPWLMVGQCATVAVNGPAYVPPPGNYGPYYLGAVIDAQNTQPELIEDNNSNSGYRMGVGNAPDFIVKSVTGPASAQPGQQVTAQVEVCNQGTMDGSTGVEMYLSADAVITPPAPPFPPEDSLVGGAPTPWLMVGQCATVAVNIGAYPPPPGGDGAYYLGAVIDPQNAQPELIEDNNSSSGYRMGVGNAPDFVVKSVTGPASAQPGQSFTAQVEVCNEGTADGSTDVEVYLSADAVITPPYGVPQPPDYPFGMAPTPWLMKGQCATVAVNGSAYPPPPGGDGPYYFGAVADPQNSQMELIEDNNTNSGYRMGVGNRPDFTVTSISGPASAQPGQQVTAQVQVCNQGTMDGSTSVEVYLSADAVITPNGPPPSPDYLAGGTTTPWIMHGQCAMVTVTGPAYPPPPGNPGPYYLGAVADPQNSQLELIEDNNQGVTSISITP